MIISMESLVQKNENGISIARICASCAMCDADHAYDANCKYRICKKGGPQGKTSKVLPIDSCNDYVMAAKYVKFQPDVTNLGRVKRAEYLKWFSTVWNDPVERERFRGLDMEQIHAIWEEENQQSVYYL